MKKKLLIRKCVVFAIAVSLAGCSKPPRNFYADQYNPGLSIFTSYGFNIVTAYINDSAYINPYIDPAYFGTGLPAGNTPVSINVIHTVSTYDTLCISWQIEYNDTSQLYLSNYGALSLLMPISKSFSVDNFLAWNGKKFPIDPTTVTIQLGYYGDNVPSGTASVYFVKITPDPNDPNFKKYFFTGLFEGSIGNSIQITKGRFDFEINPSQINF
jgi:hypothetical protein